MKLQDIHKQFAVKSFAKMMTRRDPENFVKKNKYTIVDFTNNFTSDYRKGNSDSEHQSVIVEF